VRRRAEPKTLLAAAQGVWAPAVGEAVAAEAQPISERHGIVTVACRSATWAQELDLLQTELLDAVNAALGSGEDDAARPLVAGLRFTARLQERF
jgi:predicted nucleic acid-binding Zn ribbon protein